MNELGGEGWLAVNCWPTESGKMALVMKREKTFVALHKRLIEPARPLKDLDRKAILEICLRATLKEGKYTAEVSDVAGEFGTTVKGLLEHLQLLGFSTSKNKLSIDQFLLNLTNTKGKRYLNAQRKPQEGSASAANEETRATAAIPVPKRAGYKPVVPGKSSPAIDGPTSATITLKRLEDCCINNPDNDPAYPPSAPLYEMAKLFHATDEAQIERFIEEAFKNDPSLKKCLRLRTSKKGVRHLNVIKRLPLLPNSLDIR